MPRPSIDHYTGCLLGGAIGDALGFPVEFFNIAQIHMNYGKEGIKDYEELDEGMGRFTDDTQMTLFTAEGLLRSLHRSATRGIGGAYLQIAHHSYLRWLHTQGQKLPVPENGQLDLDGWLLENKILFRKMAPGNTCLDALRSGRCGTIERPVNNSKGCGGVMRVAPVGLLFNNDAEEAFMIGADLAAITHGHPGGYLSAGAFASIISFLHQGWSLEQAVTGTLNILEKWKDHEDTLLAIRKAVDLFEISGPSYKNVEKLGGGWIGEEALSIAIFCSLHYGNSFEKAVMLSVNHGGDSDSTGSITGNIVGLLLGKSAIPSRWADRLEGADIVIQMAEDLHMRCKSDSQIIDKDWFRKYPPA
jgi:ADP-ribosylglycohydrolase